MTGAVAHHPSSTPDPRLFVSVLVCAHNEERDLPHLLRSVLHQTGPSFEVREVVAVASGCTDGTLTVLREAAGLDPRIRVIIQEKREGKAAAMATAIAAAREEILLIENADTVPAPGAFEAMISRFAEPGVDLVCCRPVPANAETGFAVRVGRLLWDVHDSVSRASPKAGEAFALRRPRVALPSDIEDDDTFLGAVALRPGGRSVYARDALVYNRVPSTIGELYQQRLRINRQVIGLRRRTGVVSGTWNPVTFVRGMAGFLAESPGRAPELLALTVLEGSARFSAAAWSLLGREPLNTWEPLPSTKRAVDSTTPLGR